jgi:hypothetical protein
MTALPHTSSPSRAARYAAATLAQAPRLLSLLDREPHSPSYGSFDREHWSWKFRDFPLGMMQGAAYPLALLWRHPFPGNPYVQNERLLQWICAALEQGVARQHSDGAFDAFAPNERDPGPSLGVLHGLLEAWRLVDQHAPARLGDKLREAARKACDFALRHERIELHAFVSNHLGLFAVALLDAAELTGDERYHRFADAMIRQVIERQSPEGWYQEYGGPDPGYESLGIFHLAVYWRRTGVPAVLESLRRAVAFYAHCVHPDGSVGGVYGSRHTSLYYPGGFEMLAGEIPEAAAIAGFLAGRLDRGNVVTPASTDAENLPSIAYAYLEAALACRERDLPQPLPCEALKGVRTFPESGISVAGTERYYAVVNASKGGVCRIFDKRAERIAYEDAGYLVHAGGREWTSQRLRMGQSVVSPGTDAVACEAAFVEHRPLLATPGRFLLLRLLNLTLFRFAALGRWLRTQIVARLMGSSSPGPLRLRRTIRFLPDRVEITDRVWLTQRLAVQQVSLPRAFTGIHMGSSRYFHPAELEATPLPPVEGMAAPLQSAGSATIDFAVEFPAAGTTELVVTGPQEEKLPEGVMRA